MEALLECFFPYLLRRFAARIHAGMGAVVTVAAILATLLPGMMPPMSRLLAVVSLGAWLALALGSAPARAHCDGPASHGPAERSR